MKLTQLYIRMCRAITGIYFFLFGFVFFANAQEKSDYIITKPGDTLFGEVFLPVNTSKKVQFCPVGEKKVTTYQPTEVVGYSIQNRFVKSCVIPRKNGDPDSLFLLNLVEGPANLYHLQDKSFFYIEKDGKFYLLEKNDRVSEGRLIADHKYMGILKSLFRDCKIPEKQFEKLEFTSQSLIGITQLYNQCRDPHTDLVAKTKSPLYVRLGVMAGVIWNKASAHSTYLYKDNSISKGYTTGYTAGISASIMSSIISKIQLNTGLFLIKKSDEFIDDGFLYRLKLTSIELPFKLSYVLPAKRISPFASVGALFSVPVEQELQDFERNFSTGKFEVKHSYKLSKALEDGYILEAGLKLNFLKKIQPTLGYQHARTHVSQTDYSFKIHKILLGVSF